MREITKRVVKWLTATFTVIFFLLILSTLSVRAAFEIGLPFSTWVNALTLGNIGITIPEGATRLTVSISEGSGDLNLYLKYGSSVSGDTIAAIDADADICSDGSGANKTITLTLNTSPPLRAGKWYVAILNLNDNRTYFTLTATVDGEDELPLLVATVSGANVDFDWSAMVAANSYSMAVALSETDGNIDMSTLNFLDMGSRKTLSASGLPSGMIFYAAILADTAQGQIVSNTVQFMPFAGTITFPQSGAVLMQVDDPGGIGTITVFGIVDAAEDTVMISQISGDDGFGPFVLTVVDDKPETYTRGDLIMYFTYAVDGTVVVQSGRNSVRSENNLNDCQQTVVNKVKDLTIRYNTDREAIDNLLNLLQPINRRLHNKASSGKSADVELFRKFNALTKIFEDTLDGLLDKFAEDFAKLKEEYEACIEEPVPYDITVGSWSIVNNHPTAGDVDWYTFRFRGTATDGPIQVLQNDTALGTYSVNGKEVFVAFTLANPHANSESQEEEYVGTFIDANTIRGSWRKRWPLSEYPEWGTGNWTGTRNN